MIDEARIDAYAEARSRELTKHKKKKRKLAPASINRELATLRRLLRLAYEWQVIQRIPKVRLLAGERQREFTLSRKTEELYLAACPSPLADIAILLLDTGLRLGEAVSLEWSQVRLDPPSGSQCGFVTVLGEKAKSGRTRHVPLTERAVKMLRGWERSSGFVFHNGGGERLLESTLSHQNKRVRDLLKLSDGFVLHSLRHTYGTRLGESGADAFTIMRLMGHASITTSQRYVHPTPETLERAVRRMESGKADKPAVPLKVSIAENESIPDRDQLV
jgi:integrase